LKLCRSAGRTDPPPKARLSKLCSQEGSTWLGARHRPVAAGPQIAWPVRMALAASGATCAPLIATERPSDDLVEHKRAPGRQHGLLVLSASSMSSLHAVVAPALDKMLARCCASAFRAREISWRGLPGLALVGTTKLILRDACEGLRRFPRPP